MGNVLMSIGLRGKGLVLAAILIVLEVVLAGGGGCSVVGR